MTTMNLLHHVVFRAIGEPAFSDVSDTLLDVETYEEAELSGLHMLRIGNWRSFVVEKRYRAGGAPSGRQAGES